MKEATIIQNFQQLNNKYNKLIELTQQNLRQLYMVQTATSMTIEALTNILIEKNVMSKDDIKVYLEKEQEKKSVKTVEAKEDMMKSQPVFNTDAGIPSQDL